MLNQVSFWTPIAVGAVIGVVVLAVLIASGRTRLEKARTEAKRLVREARREADERKQEILVQAQEQNLAAQEEADKRERELENREGLIEARVRELDQEKLALDGEQKRLERQKTEHRARERKSDDREEELRTKLRQADERLEKVAGMTAEEAKAELLKGSEEEARREAARTARRIEDEARENAEREATNLVVQAMERLELKEVVESTVSFVELPSDEMKGRIIGREGRNIRAIEMATGIDLIVDDTPNAILVSSFDPVRREVAKVAIQRLVEDGRIHPARIEEVVTKVREEIDGLIDEAGVQAAFALGISDMHDRLTRLVGRTRYRTDHGQNLLQHSMETAMLAGYMATEVGARPDIAIRAGLLHEIGRVEKDGGGDVLLRSAELAARYGEGDKVVHTIRALHGDVRGKNVEAILLNCANQLSEHRPGARKENLGVFIERLHRCEAIAGEFKGVRSAYAVKAGKEIRVIVDTDVVKDSDVYPLSRKVAKAIERQVSFSGQIKVSVVRETRAIRFAV